MIRFLRRRSRRPAESHLALARLFRDSLDSFRAEVTSIEDPYGLLRSDTPEMRRYVMTLAALRSHSTSRGDSEPLMLCDVGGYFGVVAAAASQLGYVPCVVDTYGTVLTDPRYLDLRQWWERRGISVRDVDLQTTGMSLPFASASFDVVTLLAVIEHFPHTPRLVLEEIRRVLRPDGLLIVDTPNAGAIGTRVGFLLHGEGLWETVERLFFSDIPFPGHSRCYSRRELLAVLRWSGFEPDEVEMFDLKAHDTSSLRGRILYGLLYSLLLARKRELRAYLWIAARRGADVQDKGISPAKVGTWRASGESSGR